MRVRNVLGVGFEIDRGDAGLVVGKTLVEESVHGRKPEDEALTQDELRVRFADVGIVGWGFDGHRK